MKNMKAVISGGRPLDNITGEKGEEVYYADLSDDYDRTACLAQSLVDCFGDALDELESHGTEDGFFDLIADVDFLTGGVEAEKGCWEAITREILSFEGKLNQLCQEGRETMREIEEDENS